MDVIDVSTTSEPRRIGSYSLPGFMGRIVVAGTKAYVGGTGGLHVIDVSNPTQPVRLGGYASEQWIRSLAVWGGYAYLATERTGLHVVDVNDPARPVRVSGYASGYAYDVAIVGKYAYLADYDDGLQIIDISDLSALKRVGTFPGSGPLAVAVSAGGYAYLAEVYRGLRVLDVRDAVNPVSVGFCAGDSDVRRVTLMGNCAYVSEATNGVRVIDVSNPTKPRFETGYMAQWEVNQAAVVGDLVYTADTGAGLRILRMVPITPADLPTNSFVIEAEDFDFGAGQSKPEASVMPYLGGAYQGLSASSEVDYHRDFNEPSGDEYRLGETPNVPMMLTGTEAQRQRPGYEVTTNFRIGWNTEGLWCNYTRTLPAGRYTAYAACSSGEAGNPVGGRLALVTQGKGTSSQTLIELGTMVTPGSGIWGNNSLAPLKTAAGDPTEFSLPGGPVTLRFTSVYGDFDYFVLVPTLLAPQFAVPPSNQVAMVGGSVAFEAQVTGTLPLRYQWFKDGTAVPEATQPRLELTNVQTTAAGGYYLQVWNEGGTNQSQTATLTVQPAFLQGYVNLATTSNVVGRYVPVFDSDGITPLAGTNFLADFLVGVDREHLAPAKAPVALMTDTNAGAVDAGALAVPGAAAGTTVYVQMRAWPVSGGASCDLAAQSGGRYGLSAVIPVTAGGAPGEGLLAGLEPFRLMYHVDGLTIQKEPVGGTYFEGQTFVLSPLVSNSVPAYVQWERDGSPVAGGTKTNLLFSNAVPEWSGIYRLRVTRNDQQGFILSEPARVVIQAAPPGTTVRFLNRDPEHGVDAPVYDTDGQTLLQGGNMAAQLWVGSDPANLATVGEPVRFSGSAGAGYWGPGDPYWVTLAGVIPGATVWARVEVWDLGLGTTYDQALAVGGKVGRSATFQVVTGGHGSASPMPTPLAALKSFKVGAIPVFRTQPSAQQAYLGQAVLLYAGVSSVPAATLQWYFNEQPVPGATAELLRLTDIQPAQAGEYYVIARNEMGVSRSQTVVVTVSPRTSGGQVAFQNRVVGEGVDAPVFDVDGVTRLEGLAYVAELWAGPTAEQMEPVLPWCYFRTGLGAGYINPGADATRVLPNVAPGQAAYVQIRVWASMSGATYAEAVASGGKHGSSKVVKVMAGGVGEPPSLPALLVGLESFALGRAVMIVRQPVGGRFLVGDRVMLEAVVQSSSPMQLQWERNGEAVPGATSAQLLLSGITLAQTGSYRLRASNGVAVVYSAEAVVEVRPLPTGALLRFANRVPEAGLDAPVFDLNGDILISGSGFVAQLFGGADPTNLVAVGAPAPFGTGANAGYWLAGEEYWRSIPGVESGDPAYVQVKIWELGLGASFEAALAAGGRVAASEVWEVVTGGEGAPQAFPLPLTGLASLRVRALPGIVEHPRGQQIVLNRACSLRVRAASYDPVSYQWLFNEALIPGATNSTLELPRVTAEQYGTYQAIVSTTLGSVASRAAEVTQKVLTTGGELYFANVLPAQGVVAPVFAEDGITPLAGAGYLAQLYVGTSPSSIQPVGAPTYFGSGGAVYAAAGDRVVLAMAPPDALVFVQLRAWRAEQGASFEAALKSGNPIAGASKVISVVAGGQGIPPAPLLGLESFQLLAGLRSLTKQPGVGGPLALQTSTNLTAWQTLDTLTNVPVEVFFAGLLETGETTRFYRLWETAGGHLASTEVHGLMRCRLPSGLSMVGVPLAFTNRTIGSLFSGFPTGVCIYQYSPENQRYRIDLFEFGSWNLPNQRLTDGEGCILSNPTAQPIDQVWQGPVPLGSLVRSLPVGWSIQANPLPVAVNLSEIPGLPLADGDLIARFDNATGTYLIDAYEGGWLGGRAPVIEAGEAFWLWKSAAGSWLLESPAGR